MSSKLLRVNPEWPTEKGPRIAFVGEAPGEKEAIAGKPFVGGVGVIFNWLLANAGISRAGVYVGNSFRDRPAENKVGKFFLKKGAAKKAGLVSRFPPCAEYGIVLSDREPDIELLIKDLTQLQPNVVVAMGNVATWALTGIGTGITKNRGYITPSNVIPGLKVLPTFHPSSIMRQWDQAALVGMDFQKALRESAYPEVRRPKRELTIEPTLDELAEFYANEIQPLRGTGRAIACDVETVTYFDKEPAVVITCIGFAARPDCGITVPLRDARAERGGVYWSAEDEQKVYAWLEKIICDPEITLLFHNGPFDMQVLLDHGLPVHHIPEDTMFCTHAQQPELKKGLGVLGSIFTDEVAWKTMVDFKVDDFKPED
jgi:uracil-DNA glycosylase